MEKKVRRLSIKLTQSDYEKIHKKAEQANKNITDYVTNVCLGKQIFRIDGLEEVIKQLKAIGRNINQLTILANMGKITALQLEDVKNELAQINALIKNMLEKRNWKEWR